MVRSFVYSQKTEVPNRTLALVYGEEKETEAIQGDKAVIVPQRDPYLLVGMIDKAVHAMIAKEEVRLKSKEGSVTITPKDLNIDTKNLTIEADENINLLPGLLNVPENLKLTAKRDITNNAAQIEAGGDIKITSQMGNIIETSLKLKPKIQHVNSHSTITQQDVITPSTKAGVSIEMSAPNGKISQEGTHMKAGKAIQFDAKKHIVKPAYTTTEVNSKSGRTTSQIKMTTPVAPVVNAPEILFDSKDTTLVGAQIIATNRVENHGKLYATAAKGTKDSYAKTVKYRRCFGIRIGKSTQKVEDHETFYEPTRITGDYFENTGDGSVTLEGAVVDIAKEMNINGKDLIDKTFYTHKNTKVTRHSSGFFAPKIKGDPFIESTKALRHVSFGDLAPSALNVVGAGAQTLTHATMLANLSKMNNPMATLSSILMSRFVSGFGYSNITQRTTIKQKIPHQTQVKVGILKVSNDHTHLEGIWNVDEAHINTKKFTTSAPKYDVKQNSQSSGFCVSLSPAAMFSAAIMPGVGSTLACLPSIGASESDGHAERTVNIPMRFNANKLFIQCDNAVFSASQIRAKFIEMVVSGDLTIESLRDTFMSESNSSEINGSLAAVFSTVHGVTNYRSNLDPKLGIVPHLRIAKEEEITKKVNTLAELVGTEKFYLKVGELLYKKGADVGLRPDGLVVKSDAERIEAERILSQNIPSEHSHKRKVINPSLGELVAAMGQIDEFRHVKAQMITELTEKGTPSSKTQQIVNSLRKEDVAKVTSLKHRILNTQHRLAQKSKEIASRIAKIKVNDEMNQKRLQTEIVRCVYAKELNDEIAKAQAEQIAIKQEYDTFAKSLNPEIKGFFDRIMKTTMELGTAIADGCHKFNDYLERSEEIGWMYAVCDDDTLLDATERQTFKENVINREIRKRQHGLLEFANAALRVTEITWLTTGSVSIMTNATREMKLVQAFSKARLSGETKITFGKPMYHEPLKWTEERIAHITERHTTVKLSKPEQGIFWGNFQNKINVAWQKAKELNISPVVLNDVDYYVVPFANAGYIGGGLPAQKETLNYISIMVNHGTSVLKNAFPTYKSGPKQLKNYIQETLFKGVK